MDNPSCVTHIGENGAGADLQVIEGVLLEGAEGDLVGANILSDDLGGESNLFARVDVYDLVPEKKGSFDSSGMSWCSRYSGLKAAGERVESCKTMLSFEATVQRCVGTFKKERLLYSNETRQAFISMDIGVNPQACLKLGQQGSTI